VTYYLVENFNKGLDLRRSREVAPPGSLRVLKNAFVNAGGEIEKRKAFVKNTALTAYGQEASFKGKIVGPMPVPAYTNTVFFRHHDSTAVSTSGFTAGAGLGGTSYAHYTEDGSGLAAFRFWAHRAYNSSYSFASPVMPHNASVHEFGAASYGTYAEADFAGQIYAVDATYDPTVTNNWNTLHLQQYMLVDTGEPFEFDTDSGLEGRGPQITLKSKSYTISDDILYSSAIGDPLDFVNAGSGALKISSQGMSIGRAMYLASYYQQLAIFGVRGVQFYEVDPDFDLTQYLRTVATTLFAPRSVVGYADGDLIYLSRTGIRSLQARDSSNLAITTDVGSPIDRLIRDEIRYDPDTTEAVNGTEYPIADFYSLAKGVVYPMAGEYWLFLKDKIYVLSRHTGADVLAWSQYELPKPAVANVNSTVGTVKSQWCADACQIGDTITFRNFADEMFVYGGSSGEEYDDAEAVVVTPFMDMERPGHNKYFTGLDLVCEGKWEIEITLDPVADDEDLVWRKIAEVDGRTRQQFRVAFNAQATQIALRLTTKSARRARLSQIGIYYEQGAEK